MVDLSKLKEINEELNTCLGDITTYPDTQTVNYMVEGGKCIGFNLHHCDDVAIQRAHMEKDTFFPRHSHDAIEYLIQISGKAKLTIYSNGDIEKEVDMTRGKCFRIPENKSHSYKAITSSWMLGITIPAVDEYPGIREGECCD